MNQQSNKPDLLLKSLPQHRYMITDQRSSEAHQLWQP